MTRSRFPTGTIGLAVAVAALGLASAADASHNTTDRVSAGQINGNGVFNASFAGASQDGTRAFFVTDEQLVSADTDSQQDVYERSGGATTLVSAGQINGNGAFNATFVGSSQDGTRVFFVTYEPLVSADTDSSIDLYERSGGTTALVSAGQINGNGAFDVGSVGASQDGTRVVFRTNEQLASADSDSQQDVYERASGTTTLLSTGPAGGNGAFDAFFEGASGDGTRVFVGTAEQLTTDDTDASFDLYERTSGTTTRLSLGPVGGNGGLGAAFRGASQDGTRVFFVTTEQLVTGDTDSSQDIYERSSGTTTLVSQGQINGNGAFDANFPPGGASQDGTRVFFYTDEQLVSGDTDSSQDLYQRSGGASTLVSAGQINGNGAFPASFVRASQDGTRVFLHTNEQLVSADADSSQDVYQRSGSTTTLVSQGLINGNGAFPATFAGMSQDGTRVFFEASEQLVSADTDTEIDVYERSAGSTYRISAGPSGGNGANYAVFAGASQDGVRVFFHTYEPLVTGDTDAFHDVYVTGGFPVATYATPAGASGVTVSLVPAYRQTISATQCTARGGTPKTHAAPFSLTSCDPPALPAGTQAFFGRAGSGAAALTVIAGNPLTNANEGDDAITANLTDIRSGSINGADYNPNAGGPDVTLVVKLRISDLFNGTSQTDPGTVSDLDFSAAVNCSNTADAGIGASCSVSTTANAITTNAVVEGKQAVLSAFRVRVNDSGANGIRGDSDDRNFAQQGLFNP